jgi:hypothetical protein
VNRRVQPLEFDPRVVGGEPPVDGAAGRVAPILPGGNFSLQGGLVGDAPVQALPTEDAQLDLSEPMLLHFL